MKNFWKGLVAKKWFPAAVMLAVLFTASAFYTGLTRNETPVTQGSRSILVPAQRMVTHGAVSVANIYNRFVFYDDLVEENEELKKQISEMQTELTDAQDALDENKELRDMLGVVQRGSDFTYETAEVVAREMDDWSVVLTIDAGRKDGLRKYDCVVNSDGLIGYITDISAHSAEVTTVLDPNMQCGASIMGTDAIGVAKGDYSMLSDGLMRVSYLTHGADITKGTTVQTTGSGGIFPEGLLIGKVRSVKTESDGKSDYAVVEPFVDVTGVTRVFVITDYSITN